jgi:hypothetical protein
MNILIITIVLAVTGIWNLAWALISKTKNLISSILFKVVPFFFGLALLFCIVLLNGWIKL